MSFESLTLAYNRVLRQSSPCKIIYCRKPNEVLQKKKPSHPGFQEPNFNFICWISSHLPNIAIWRIKFRFGCWRLGWDDYVFKTYPPDKLSRPLCSNIAIKIFICTECFTKKKVNVILTKVNVILTNTRVLNVTVMQHATTLVDLFIVHVTMDFQEMEQSAQVQKFTNLTSHN